MATMAEEGEPSTPRGFSMDNVEQLSDFFTAIRRAMKNEETEVRQEKIDRFQEDRVTKCLQAVLSSEGEFKGKDVTKYLRVYWRQVEVYKIDQETAVLEFSTLVEPELKSSVERLMIGHERGNEWRGFCKKMKHRFLMTDSERMTEATFLDWIRARNKGLEAEELLLEFKRKLNQLPSTDLEFLSLQKISLFLRSSDRDLRDELEYALDLINPQRLVKVTWDHVEQAVEFVATRRRDRALDDEAVAKPAVLSNTTGKGKAKEELALHEKKVGTSDLSKILESLNLLTKQLVSHKSGSGGSDRPASSRSTGWGCMWCDSKDHQKRECVELSEALRHEKVKYVGEPGMKKLSYFDTGEAIPLNGDNGGMKVLVEKHLRETEVKMVSVAYDPEVYTLGLEPTKPLDTSEVEKKRLAAFIRQQTGWDDPVLITPYAVKIASSWEVQVEDKRRESPRLSAIDKGKKKVQFSDDIPVPIEKEDAPSIQSRDDNAKKESTNSKSPGWVLGRDIEREIEPEVIAQNFWKQEVQGFTNEELFGCMRKDIQESILAKARKKRVYKEGPQSLLSGVVKEQEQLEENTYLANVWEAVSLQDSCPDPLPKSESRQEVELKPTQGDSLQSWNPSFADSKTETEVVLDAAHLSSYSNYEEIQRPPPTEMRQRDNTHTLIVGRKFDQPENPSQDLNWARVYEATVRSVNQYLGWNGRNCLDSFWARACTECDIVLCGVDGPIRALIDSGSEVNLMSMKVYNEGLFPVDRDIEWGVNGINADRNALWGACPSVSTRIGNIVELMNIFVHVNLPYPIILGQPFITEMRMETKILDDGTHFAKIRSKDGLRVVQFPTCHPDHRRNQKELRDAEKKMDFD